MSGRLDGRVAVLTGAAGGLGSATARRLVGEGCAVACTGLPGDPLDELVAELEGAGGRALALVCDQRDPDAVEAAAVRVREEWGRVDVLVNNAAVYASRPWHEITVEDWDRTLEVNLRGCFVWALALRGDLAASPAGRVVNVASLTFFVGFDGLADYVASKGGIIGLTRTLSREMGPDAVTVNAVSPGAFPTDPEKIHPDPEGYDRWVLDRQALKRRGRGEDVGDLVVFLASDEASFITGQTIMIDGGWVNH